MCFLPGCACCEMMVFAVVGLFCCGGINSNGFDVGFVTFDWLTVYVRFMCEEVFHHWLSAFPVGCWFWYCVRDCLGGDRA